MTSIRNTTQALDMLASEERSTPLDTYTYLHNYRTFFTDKEMLRLPGTLQTDKFQIYTVYNTMDFTKQTSHAHVPVGALYRARLNASILLLALEPEC